jgi:formate hydrogenlyase subunit 3/multisubunit Na+/H+ antiporter MnhD subunit
MSFAVIMEFATFMSYAVVLLGGVQQRSYGWKMVCALLGIGALCQIAGMSIIVRDSLNEQSSMIANG